MAKEPVTPPQPPAEEPGKPYPVEKPPEPQPNEDRPMVDPVPPNKDLPRMDASPRGTMKHDMPSSRTAHPISSPALSAALDRHRQRNSPARLHRAVSFRGVARTKRQYAQADP
jgi:hypothetical protein